MTVKTNDNFTAETKNCQPARISGVKLNEDGTATLTVPTSASGSSLMILESGDATISPAN